MKYRTEYYRIICSVLFSLKFILILTKQDDIQTSNLGIF